MTTMQAAVFVTLLFIALAIPFIVRSIVWSRFINQMKKGNAQKALSIPRCVIIGKDGEIKFKSAASPEDMEKLKSQLKEAAQTGA